MGAVCVCGSGKKSSTYDLKHDIPVGTESHKTQSSAISKSTTNIHSSEELLNDHLQSQITEAIDEYTATIPTAYQIERDRIVNEMSRSAPSPYLGLVFSDYPDVNGPTVNGMACRLVTSNEIKQRLIDQIDQRIESTFVSRTTDWKASSRDAARPVVRVFIEKHVHEAFDRVKLE